MPRGRPRKNPIIGDVVKVKKTTPKQKLKAVFLETVDIIDPDSGYRVNINIYRVQPKKRKFEEENYEDDYTYVGFDEEFINNLEKDIIPTPLGVAELVDSDDSIEDEEDDTYFDY